MQYICTAMLLLYAVVQPNCTVQLHSSPECQLDGVHKGVQTCVGSCKAFSYKCAFIVDMSVDDVMGSKQSFGWKVFKVN